MGRLRCRDCGAAPAKVDLIGLEPCGWWEWTSGAAGRAARDRKPSVNLCRAMTAETRRKESSMPATVLAFPTTRCAQAASTGKRPGKVTANQRAKCPKAPVRFASEVRNTLNGIAYAVPEWGVRFSDHESDGSQWAEVFDHRWRDDAFVRIAPEPDGGLGLYDHQGKPVEIYETPAELVAALRCWLR